MKREATISLSAAVLSLAFLSGSAQAQGNNSSNLASEQAEAQQMVPAQATFDKSFDAKKAQQGQQFEVTLNQNVKLKDGEELPHGTVLEGKVVTDNVQSSSGSKLVLRFAQAHLKDGKTIPIRATITGVYSQGSLDAEYGSDWTPTQIDIEQEGAMHGVDLHSRIGAENSGTFEAKNKGDVKFDRGSALSLAIAPGQSSSSGKGVS